MTDSDKDRYWAGAKCPFCRNELMVPRHPLTNEFPQAEDGVVCAGCKRVCIVGQDGRLRPPTPTDVAEWIADGDFGEQYDLAIKAMSYAGNRAARNAEWHRLYRDKEEE